MIRRCLFAALALSALGLMATAFTAQPALRVSGAWVREPLGSRLMTSAYAVVENRESAEVRIVSVTADVAGSVEMHEMTRAGDTMKMAPVQALVVPAGGSVEFRPGGTHLMLFALERPLTDGDAVTLTFTTSTGGHARAIATVKKPQARQ
jgi:periplasmic copper chaperone A